MRIFQHARLVYGRVNTFNISFIPMLKHFLVSFSPCLITINLRKWQQFFLKVDKVDQAWVNVADTILSNQSQRLIPDSKKNRSKSGTVFPHPSPIHLDLHCSTWSSAMPAPSAAVAPAVVMAVATPSENSPLLTALACGWCLCNNHLPHRMAVT